MSCSSCGASRAALASAQDMDRSSCGRLCSAAQLVFTLSGCALMALGPGVSACRARGSGPVLPQPELLQGLEEPAGARWVLGALAALAQPGWGAGRRLPWLTECCCGPGHSAWQSPARSPSNPLSVSLFLSPGSKTQGVVQGVTSGMVPSSSPSQCPSGLESVAALTRSEAN